MCCKPQKELKFRNNALECLRISELLVQDEERITIYYDSTSCLSILLVLSHTPAFEDVFSCTLHD